MRIPPEARVLIIGEDTHRLHQLRAEFQDPYTLISGADTLEVAERLLYREQWQVVILCGSTLDSVPTIQMLQAATLCADFVVYYAMDLHVTTIHRAYREGAWSVYREPTPPLIVVRDVESELERRRYLERQCQQVWAWESRTDRRDSAESLAESWVAFKDGEVVDKDASLFRLQTRDPNLGGSGGWMYVYVDHEGSVTSRPPSLHRTIGHGDPYDDSEGAAFDLGCFTEVKIAEATHQIATMVTPQRFLGWEGGPVKLECDTDEPELVWVLSHDDTGSGFYYFMDRPDDPPGMNDAWGNIPRLNDISPENVLEAASCIIHELFCHQGGEE